ncbi:UNKNOWN [Stylonychia lemnae]|uniref:PH domain-containing protein n=1 Tax=Stylonychia lemnae TaxID=5949 RepID=A0A078B2A0_STYLE|nr:UNKNOWN [Stylonychia lemnae]|eukprot:CDW88609.1 UNKNOWN [Stylonychia lemnae]
MALLEQKANLPLQQQAKESSPDSSISMNSHLIEGYLIKLKSQASRKFFSNYVKRYFILDLQKQTFSYKLSDKLQQDKFVINLKDIIKVHNHSTIGQNDDDKVDKNLLLEWQFDFMIEFIEQQPQLDESQHQDQENSEQSNLISNRQSPIIQSDDKIEPIKIRKMILLSNNEELYLKFVYGLNSKITPPNNNTNIGNNNEVRSDPGQSTNRKIVLGPQNKDQLFSTRQSIIDELDFKGNPLNHSNQFRIKAPPQMLSEGLDVKRKYMGNSSPVNKPIDNNRIQTRMTPDQQYREQIYQIKQIILVNQQNPHIQTLNQNRRLNKNSHNNANAPQVYKELMFMVKSQADQELEEQAIRIYQTIIQQDEVIRDGFFSSCDQSLNYQFGLNEEHKLILLERDSDCEWTLDIEEKGDSNKNDNGDNLNILDGDFSFECFDQGKNCVSSAHVNTLKVKTN